MKFENYCTLFFVVLCAISFVSCDDDKDDNEYPKTITTEKLLVNGEEVSDTYFYMEKEDSLYIIDSDDILFGHIRLYPTLHDAIPKPLPQPLKSNVDYTKNSVFLIGDHCGGISKIEKAYIQESTKKYTLKIKVYLTGTEELREWALPIVVSKVDSNMEVSAEVEYISPEFY